VNWGRKHSLCHPGIPVHPGHESSCETCEILPDFFLSTLHPFCFDVSGIFERKESNVTYYPGMPRKTITRVMEHTEQIRTWAKAGLFF
jgi:hypothetical protein